MRPLTGVLGLWLVVHRGPFEAELLYLISTAIFLL